MSKNALGCGIDRCLLSMPISLVMIPSFSHLSQSGCRGSHHKRGRANPWLPNASLRPLTVLGPVIGDDELPTALHSTLSLTNVPQFSHLGRSSCCLFGKEHGCTRGTVFPDPCQSLSPACPSVWSCSSASKCSPSDAVVECPRSVSRLSPIVPVEVVPGLDIVVQFLLVVLHVIPSYPRLLHPRCFPCLGRYSL